MVLEEIKKISSSTRELRGFGFVMGIAFLIIAGVIYFFSLEIITPLLWIALGFEVLGLLAPITLLPLHKIWMALSIILGTIMTLMILTSLYYLIVTPISLTGRLLGKRFLETKPDKDSATYWEQRDSSVKPPDSYKRQF